VPGGRLTVREQGEEVELPVRPAGHLQGLADDEPGLVGQQEGDGVGDVLGLAESERTRRRRGRHPSGRARLLLEVGLLRGARGHGDESRGDAVHPDAVTGHLEGDFLRQGDDAGLRGRVAGMGCRDVDRRHRRDVHDGAPPALHHAGEDTAQEEVGAPKVHADLSVEVLISALQVRLDDCDPGVVHEQADRAEVRFGRLDDPFDVIGGADVGGDCQNLRSRGCQFLDRRLQSGLVEIDQCDGRTVGGQTGGDRLAESRGRPCHHCDLLAEVIHGVSRPDDGRPHLSTGYLPPHPEPKADRRWPSVGVLETLGEVGTGRDPELVIDVLQVVLHRPDGDAQLGRDLLVGPPGGSQQGRFPLGLGQAGPAPDRHQGGSGRVLAGVGKGVRPLLRPGRAAGVAPPSPGNGTVGGRFGGEQHRPHGFEPGRDLAQRHGHDERDHRPDQVGKDDGWPGD